MLAACYVGDRTVELVETDARRPGAGEVEIGVAYTGICGTDLHIVHGAMDARVARPAVLGHEMSGSIAAVGEGVDSWSIGDHVTVMPLAWCGHCPACRAGHSHICHNLNFLGIDSPGIDAGELGRPGRCARRTAFRPPVGGWRSGRADCGRSARRAPVGPPSG